MNPSIQILRATFPVFLKLCHEIQSNVVVFWAKLNAFPSFHQNQGFRHHLNIPHTLENVKIEPKLPPIPWVFKRQTPMP